jgi:hypothetical protein
LAAIKEPSPDFRGAIRQMPDCSEVDGYVIEEFDYDAVGAKELKAKNPWRLK